ncbi:MAG: hypothetical protein IJN82_03465 [Clostridia bacterium]|nr:hypothetical protein [Clostridia bacterium]
MKRILCLILALLMLVPTAYADVSELPPIIVSLSAGAVKVGDTVRVTTSVKDAPLCASYHIIYSYDTEVLKPVEGKNLNTGGLFTTNINPTKKGTINTVAADAKKVIEGNLDLFYTDFEVIAAPKSGQTTSLEFTYLEFYTPQLELLVNVRSEPCAIPVIGAPKPVEPENNTPEQPSEPETPEEPAPSDPIPVPDTPVDTPVDDPVATPPAEDTVGGSTEETEEPEELPTLPQDSEGKDPTGDWEFDEEKQEVTLTTPEGEDKTYTYQPIIDPETNQQSGVVIYDEDGKEAGKLKVEKDESGKLNVLKEFIETAADPSPLLFILPIALAVLIGGGLVAFYVIKQKKAPKAEEPNE